GRVDTAGFVASTLNIRNEDFLAGRNLFINDGGAKDVINQGEIRTPAGGSVYLIGTNVSNEGIITTPKGETILAAGATVSLIDSATPGVKVDITGAEGNVTNLGEITAEAGRIGIAGVIVRNSGTLNASSVVSEGGRIFLIASQDAYVDAGSIIDSGTREGGVELFAGGGNLSIADNAEIHGGGTGGTVLLHSANISLNKVAGPVNPVVVSGSASFNQAGGVLTVTNSNGAIIDWDKFSIQLGEITRFVQPSASSAVFNRVLGEPSPIYGKLSSNGRVWLVNPAGIIVGPGGRIDVAAHVGKTLNANSTEFHAARLQPIIDGTFAFRNAFNHSQTTIPVGGSVYRIGNERTTTVPGGQAVPGAIVSLIDSSTPGVKVDVIAGTGSNIDAASITAAALRVGIAGVLVRNSDTLGARGSR
ncbi:filamentous hemagglutinin N-terminal domain-containing protein, partial [Zavarzinia sp.]|uniref:two-partner secretion domain-containing protein n=1 Tax=Zavarzinia sp. TaxID=2027920 RepID=UPI00356ABE29